MRSICTWGIVHNTLDSLDTAIKFCTGYIDSLAIVMPFSYATDMITETDSMEIKCMLFSAMILHCKAILSGLGTNGLMR